MNETTYLTNHLLIAMPTLEDPNFFHTVTYICEHNADGAMGIVINRPLELSLGEVVEHMELPIVAPQYKKSPIFLGGPVQPERGFVLHVPTETEWEASLLITKHLSLTTSRDVISSIANGDGPHRFLIALGYAGWGPGQLEREMTANAWLSGPVDPKILFDTPIEQRWLNAAALLGVDLNLLSSEAGHA